MKNTNDSIIKNYIKKVTKFVPATYRSRLKTELQNSIMECFHDVPELTASMLQERFGTPENFAAEYLSSMDGEELHATLDRSRKQKRILAVALICLLLLLIPISIWILTEGERHREYFYSSRIEVSNAR